MKELTVKNLVAAIANIEDNQIMINQACAEAFTGRNVKAPKDSCLHGALVALIKIRDKFNKAHKTANDTARENAKLNGVKAVVIKYNGLNILSTEVTRWVNKVNRVAKYNGLRASIKATGGASKFSIALVQTTSAQSADAATASKATSETKAKQLTNLMNDSSISLDEALVALVDSYTLVCVQTALAKLA